MQYNYKELNTLFEHKKTDLSSVRFTIFSLIIYADVRKSRDGPPYSLSVDFFVPFTFEGIAYYGNMSRIMSSESTDI